ncbi:MAG TPA: prepilin-type N-terminal cleavage/methylation domain-containing protein [Verrucomicrobiota bacterium]|nr:prepilin-type N-terminal cleavage/methylation domain-containing protein [Verrucomicrobiota bacterium]
MRRTSLHRRLAAFTMIEVMIAIFIMSFIMAAIYSSWTAITRSAKVGLEAASRVQRSRMALRTIVDSLLSVQMFAQNLNYYSFIADTSSDFAYLSLAANLPQSFPRGGLYGDFTVRRVTFSVEPGDLSGNQLVMWQEPILMETNSADEVGPLVLASDISLFVLEFWDARAGEWIEEWLYTNQLPKLIRVTLGFGESGYRQPQEIVSRVVALPAMAVPREYQVPPASGAPRPGAGVPPGTAQPRPGPRGEGPTQSPGGIPANRGGFPMRGQ